MFLKESLRLSLRNKKKRRHVQIVNLVDNTIFIDSNIIQIWAALEVTQTFTNFLWKAIVLVISFPLKPEIQLKKYKIISGNETTISKVFPKEKAE